MTYASEVLADSPLGYWKLDETSGTTAADSSGNSRPLTLNGAVTVGAAPIIPGGTASYDFPGATTAFLKANAAAWMAVTSFTVDAWVRPDVVTSLRCIMSRENTSGSNRQWSFYANAAKLDLFTSVTHPGTSSLLISTIYHVAMVYDAAASTAKYYINGVLDATITGLSVTNSFTATPYDLFVGVSHAAVAGLNFAFDGRMSDLAYYGTALSGARIAAHYTATTVQAATGSGSLSLSGSAAAVGAGAASGSLLLSGSGDAATQAAAAGTGTLDLAGTGGTVAPTPASGTGAITLIGSGSPGIGVAGSGSLSLSGSGTGQATLAATGAGSISLSGSGSATLAAGGSGSITFGSVAAAFALYRTDLTNALNGRRRRGRATAWVDRPAAPPPGRALGVRYDKAIAYPVPTIVEGRPT